MNYIYFFSPCIVSINVNFISFILTLQCLLAYKWFNQLNIRPSQILIMVYCPKRQAENKYTTIVVDSAPLAGNQSERSILSRDHR